MVFEWFLSDFGVFIPNVFFRFFPSVFSNFPKCFFRFFPVFSGFFQVFFPNHFRPFFLDRCFFDRCPLRLVFLCDFYVLICDFLHFFVIVNVFYKKRVQLFLVALFSILFRTL